ncbi:hypothetical protein D3C85_1326630 [compost metagenome]
MVAPSVGAVVDIGELRKTISEIDLLGKRQAQGETRPQKNDNSSTSSASVQSRPVSSVPMSTSTEDGHEPISPSATVIDPLPAIDTSPMAYPSLTVTPFGSVATASVASASPPVASGSFSGAAIEASPREWYVAGTAWYWWFLSILAVGVGAGWYLRGRKQAE